MLPNRLEQTLIEHLAKVRVLYTQDLAAQQANVFLPDALARKYPNAPREWAWQWVFPAKSLSADPRTGLVRRHHLGEETLQRAVKAAIGKAGIAKHGSCHTLRHSFATHLIEYGYDITPIKPSNHPRTTRPCRCPHHHDLHPCPQPGRAWRPQPPRPSLTHDLPLTDSSLRPLTTCPKNATLYLMSDTAVTEESSAPKRARVVVVGSANTDMVARVARLPLPGETVLGGDFATAPGGKGANQAVAAARLGAVVTLIACVGLDSLGDAAVLGFEAEGIDTQYVVRDPEAPTGVALITVDAATGENSIVVASGANAKLSVGLIQMASGAIRDADVVICQLESPLATVQAALQLARDAGKTTILNPAPAQVLPDALLALVSVLTPNETEAALMAGDAAVTPAQMANALRERGAASVVVTLGAKGALVVTEKQETLIQSFAPKETVDTTAAGDCFTGALAVALGEGKTLGYAVEFANAAASLSVEKAGAQPSLPNRYETDLRLID